MALLGPSFQRFASSITACRDPAGGWWSHIAASRRQSARPPHFPEPLCDNRVRLQSCEERLTVECWIGIVQEDDRRIVRLAGRLAEAQVPELLMACAQPGPLQLDLSDLFSADVAGLEALERVQARGAVLVGVPGYIRLQLEARSPARGRRPGGKL